MPHSVRSVGRPILLSTRRCLELVGQKQVGDEGTGPGLQLGIVPPVVGVTDLVDDGFELGIGLVSWSPGSSRSADPGGSCSSARMLRTISSARALASGVKFFRTYAWPSTSPSAWSVNVEAAFPAGTHLRHATEHRRVEPKALLHERGAQRGRGVGDEVPAEIGLPVFDRRRSPAGNRPCSGTWAGPR